MTPLRPPTDDGRLELRAADGTRFSLQRLGPGVLLVAIGGDDRGALGRAPFDALERELARGQPAELFIDLRAAAGATAEVRESWTGWFQRRRAALRRVSVLAGSRFVALAVEIAKLLSRTGELIRVHADAHAFERALALAAGRPLRLPPPSPPPSPSRSPLPSPPLPGGPPGGVAAGEVVREVLSDRCVRLRARGCTWQFERLRPTLLLATVEGHDAGELGTLPLDEVEAALGRAPLALYIDARRSPGASPVASEAWIAWLATHRSALRRVLVLTAERALRLTLAIADHRAGGAGLLRVTSDAAGFAGAIAAEVPRFVLAP